MIFETKSVFKVIILGIRYLSYWHSVRILYAIFLLKIVMNISDEQILYYIKGFSSIYNASIQSINKYLIGSHCYVIEFLNIFMFVNSFIGLVLICNGVCTALSSYVFGALVKYIGRVGCFIIAGVLNYATIILMYLWEPLEDQMYILYIIAGLWGISDAVWQSQVIGIILFI